MKIVCCNICCLILCWFWIWSLFWPLRSHFLLFSACSTSQFNTSINVIKVLAPLWRRQYSIFCADIKDMHISLHKVKLLDFPYFLLVIYSYIVPLLGYNVIMNCQTCSFKISCKLLKTNFSFSYYFNNQNASESEPSASLKLKLMTLKTTFINLQNDWTTTLKL